MAKKIDGLVSEYLERVGGEALENDHYRSALAGMIRGHAGVYALYKNEGLYYVGLATNLMMRVKHHLKDRHRGKWDRFSVYLTTAGDHIKPIESLLLRIIDPKGNRVKGKLPGATDLKRDLQRKVTANQADECARVLGGTFAKNRRRKKAASGNGTLVLAGSVERRLILRADYKGMRYLASLRKDGHISYKGELYQSPSAAAKAIVGRAANGWKFWEFKGSSGWMELSELRR
ncbi:MAG: DUF4357 domain-containing protein [Rhodocyclales bacterium]|nr:DUF4357 domain-containing protein [Rhodocyclales bacterium]